MTSNKDGSKMKSNKDEESQLIKQPKKSSYDVSGPKLVGAITLAFCLGALAVSASSPSSVAVLVRHSRMGRVDAAAPT